MATQKEVAEHLDISERRVRGLIKDGLLPSSKGPGGSDIDQCRIAYINYLRGLASGKVSDNRPKTDEESITDIAAEIEKEKLRKLKRENDIDENLVAPVHILTDALEKVASIVVPILKSITHEIKMAFPELTGDQAVKINNAIADCCNAIADIEIEIDEEHSDSDNFRA